jgi:O-antigen ligase
LMCVLGVLFFEPLLKSTLLTIQPAAVGTKYERKIQDVLYSLERDTVQGTLEDRWERYSRSANTFAERPLLGSLKKLDSGIGKHSSILDTYARFGIVLGSIWAYLLFFLPVAYAKRLQNNFGAAFAFVIALGFIFIFNNSFATSGVMIFLLYPCAMNILTQMDRQTNRTLHNPA